MLCSVVCVPGRLSAGFPLPEGLSGGLRGGQATVLGYLGSSAGNYDWHFRSTELSSAKH